MLLRCFQKRSVDQLREKRESFLCASRQLGKSALCRELLSLFLATFNQRKNPVALILATTHQQAANLHYADFKKVLGDYPLVIKQGSEKDGLTLVIKRPWFGDYATIHFRGISNIKSLVGLTCDFVIGDEFAYYNKEDYLKAVTPITDATNGYRLNTSTIEDNENLFTQMLREEDGIIFDIWDAVKAGYRTQAWAEKRRRQFEVSNTLHIWKQQYECDPNASTADIKPFLDFALRSRKKLTDIDVSQFSTINVVVDLGKKGSFPVIEFTVLGNQPIILDAHNEVRNAYELMDKLIKKSKANYRIIWSWDCVIPSSDQGISKLKLYKEYVRKKGYTRRIKFDKLDKTKCKRTAIDMALDYLEKPLSINRTKGIHQLLLGLESVQYPKQKKTGYIDMSKFSTNGYQHYADCLIHFHQAIQFKKFRRNSGAGNIGTPSFRYYRGS